jgi:hypothetical protein
MRCKDLTFGVESLFFIIVILYISKRGRHMYQILDKSNLLIILIVLALSLFILSKAADFLVDNAVKLSEILGLPELIIGATILCNLSGC